VNIGTKVWSLIFGQSCTTVASSYVYNTESLSKTKHNLTFRIWPKIKLQTLCSDLHQILMDFKYFIFHKVV